MLPGESYNFHNFLSFHSLKLIKTLLHRCGHCKQLTPEYAEAARRLKESNLTLAKVDATREAALAKEYMIQGFPTIILFQNGEKVEEYQGERNADGTTNCSKSVK